jgi:hypothetical protein
MADLNIVSPTLHEQPAPIERDTVLEDAKRPSAVDTAAAIWRRDAILGSALAEIGLGEDDATTKFDPNFNPYAHFKKNQGALTDLEPWLRKGTFDNARNEADFNRIATRVRMQLDDMQTIEQGSGWGLALGMGLSLLDVATLVPFAKAKTGASMVSNAFRVGASGAALGVGQEAALHALEPTRTSEESFWNIGTTTALGGGIGVFASVLHPKSSLNPKNKPPLTGDEVHPIGSRIPGTDGEDVIGSVGRCAYRRPDGHRARCR